MNILHRPIRSACASAFVLVLWFMLLPACESQPTARDGNTSAQSLAGWTIILDGFEGPNHQALAQQQAAQFTQATGLTGYWVSNSSVKSEVNFGRYNAPDSAQARQDLDRLKALAQSGRITPRTLTIVPALPDATGPNAQWELRHARVPDAIYTLVIEQYTPQFGANFRQQAEKDCVALRDQMIEAYYYHGPGDSVVTIGQFGNAAAKIATEGPNAGRTEYHPFITGTLQKQYPAVKVNGKSTTPPVPTFLIRIPD